MAKTQIAISTGIMITVAQIEAVTEKYVNLTQDRSTTSKVKKKMEKQLARIQAR